uniref:Uncharacterized protein n=1 Tax=Monodopsis sp. MarTras21 TaxID=1745953 RepID=A0A1D8RDL7_9STRA|nr:hypothetical protein [Monodopsis sp. MarTras21]
MQTLPIIKNQLGKFYCLILHYKKYLPYNHLIVKFFTSGNNKVLYLIRLLFPFTKLTSKLLLLFGSSLKIFTFISQGLNTFIPIRFWLLVFYHFMVFFDGILTIRLIMEWYPSINPNEGSLLEQTIMNLTEPYLKIAGELFPRGVSTIFVFLLVEQLLFFIQKLYRVLVTYGSGSKKRVWFEILDIFSSSIYYENMSTI